jgi:hypothetical protein
VRAKPLPARSSEAAATAIPKQATEPPHSLLLSRECDNRCIFCAQDGLAAAPPLVPSLLDPPRHAGRGVTFVGGEPTLDSRLLELVARARRAGATPIVLQTNGAKLDASFVRELRSAGLSAAHLSIHGASPEVHDYHTGVPGSFGRAILALEAAVDAGLTTAVTTVVTRSNFRVLSALVPLLARMKTTAWALTFPEVAGRAIAAMDRVIPRLGLAVPHALYALETASRAGLPAFLSGVPACLLGPFASRSLPHRPRAFGDACESCEARVGCAGVDPLYLARFQADELSPVTSTPLDPIVLDLGWLFAGAGDLASPPAASGVVARSVKRALPVLGRVKPAVGEVSPNAPRRSGHALREILPDLFESAPTPDATETK